MENCVCQQVALCMRVCHLRELEMERWKELEKNGRRHKKGN